MEESKKASKPKSTRETALKGLVTLNGDQIKKGEVFTCQAKEKAHFKKHKAI